MATKRHTLASVVKAQGRTPLWLADQTGVTVHYIRRVLSGNVVGSVPLHLTLRRILGVEYELPAGAKKR